MKKVTPHTLNPNWGSITKRPTWSHITSAELAQVLGVHLQTINNWKLRNILPPPADRNPRLRGNKNYYQIAAIRSWLENKTPEEIHNEWVRENMADDSATPQQIQCLTNVLMQSRQQTMRL